MSDLPAPLPPARVNPPAGGSRRDIAALRRRRALIAVLALVLTGGALWSAALAQERARDGGDRYTTVMATRGSVTQVLTAAGTVQELNDVSVRFPAAGTVTEVRVAPGDAVRAGDVLAVMDDAALRTRVLRAQADVDAAALALQQTRQSAEAVEDAAAAESAPVGLSTGVDGLADAIAEQTVPDPAPLPELPPAPEPGIDLGPLTDLLARADAAALEVATRREAADAALAAVREQCPLPDGPATPTPDPSAEPTDTPSPTPGPTPSSGPAPDPTATPDPTVGPVPTVGPDPTATPDPTGTPDPTAPPDPTGTPAPTATPDPTGTPDPTVTPDPTAAPQPTDTPDPTAAPDPTADPTAAPDPTADPTAAPDPIADPTAAPDPTATADPTVTPTPDPSTTPGPTAPPSPEPSSPAPDPEACVAALEASATAQMALDESQRAAGDLNAEGLGLLQALVGALNEAVTQVQAWAAGAVESLAAAWEAAATPQVVVVPAPPSAPVPGPSLPDASLGDSGTQTGTPVVQRSPIVSAEVALGKARRALEQATSDLENASLRTPVDGVVASLPFTVGSVASPTQRAVISTPGGIRVTMTIPASAFTSVQPGQTAQLRGSGGAQAQASVLTKNLVPTGTGAYPVTVVSTGADAEAFAPGTNATVEIEVSNATDVVVAPLTAVTRTGTSGMVRVLAGSDVVDVPVELGSVGDTRIEIISGVEVGDRLVVADAELPLPSLDW
ncbi:efflux RND transporter periplasmic adaptor subunit [Propioniciclava soli]|uniref:efflux RND transporter periplasmic adaptor subunit n=1 Tax=Propioniciclava soli TaxID=2775081 RepID=UPI001E39DB8C|nr:biotin/lipoyl-binding protein [Propioniciclava soli]